MAELERLDGAEAVERYGVCACEEATITSQVWILVRRERINERGGLDVETYVRCGLCHRRFGWWER